MIFSAFLLRKVVLQKGCKNDDWKMQRYFEFWKLQAQQQYKKVIHITIPILEY